MISRPPFSHATTARIRFFRTLGALPLFCALLCLLGGYSPAFADALADAVDQPALTFSSSDGVPWFVQTTIKDRGPSAAQSGPIGDNGTSSLSTTINGKATVNFRWKVSSEGCCDAAYFYIDGVEQQNIRGDIGWRSQTYEITNPGTHTLTWTYRKDGSAINGSDAAWLDALDIVFEGPVTAPVIKQLTTTAVASGDNAAVQVKATGGILSYQWYQGAGGDTTQPLEGATGPLLITPPLSVDSSFWVRVSNTLGTADSATAAVHITAHAGHDLLGMGSSNKGQLGIGVAFGLPAPITSLSGVAHVAAGYAHSLFLKTDGTLWAMGDNSSGQLGDGSTIGRSTLVQIATDVVQIAAGLYHSLFIKTDGSLWAMGNNSYGQLGDSDYSSYHPFPVQVAAGVTQVAAGGYHSLFTKTDGSLWAMGNNGSGQLGDGSTINRNPPVQIATDVTHLAAGLYHSLFIKTDGSLWAMGYNDYGQLGDSSYSWFSEYRSTPVQIATDVSQVAAGSYHSLFIKTDGSLWAMGNNRYGQLGDSNYSSYHSIPVQVAVGTIQVAAGGYHSLFIKTDGSLWAMGNNGSGQLGDGSTTTSSSSPVQIASDVTQIAAGGNHTLFTKTDGSVCGTGSNDGGQLGDAGYTRANSVSISTDAIKIAAGDSHSLLIKSDGSLWAMGDNGSGQLGDGSTIMHSNPVQIASQVTQIAAGYAHSLFLKADGSLWAMGDNGSGQLGDGSTTNQTTPVQIDTGVTQIAAGAYHSLFIKTDGSLWAMGGSFSYQPVRVATGVRKVMAGANHSLFLKTDGSLWAMGANSYGQLGDRTSTYRYTPVQVATSVTQISADDAHSLFIKADGSLWGMGQNYYGQLGTDLSSNIYTPTQITEGVTQIAAGSRYSLFIKSDASLWAMGSDDYGQLGDGTTGSQLEPVQIATGALAIAAGGSHSLFIKAPTHSVTFDLGDFGTAEGGGALAQTVIAGWPALAPIVVNRSSDQAFQGWDVAFAHVTTDLVVHAVYRRPQTITFTAPAAQVFSGSPKTLALAATASSALPVVFEVLSGPATLGADGHTLTLTDAGTFVLRASQPGDGTWSAATPVVVRFIAKGTGKAQKIAFAQPQPRTYGDAPFALAATAASGLPVNFEVVSGPASITDRTLSITDVGRVVLRASQPGGNGFGAAPDVTRTLVVNKAPLTVTVQNVSRLVGEPNPVFSLVYEGFVGLDVNPASLDRPPTASCKATRSSPQGSYAVTVSGGSDNHYEFRSATPAGTLTVDGFGGTYEALLLDANDSSTPVGKLTLTIPNNGLAYTGVLSLAREAKPLVVSSTSIIEGTTPFLAAENHLSATATWNHAVTGFDSLTLTVRSDGTLTGTLSRNIEAFGTLAYGRRLYTPVPGTTSPWSGQHTLALYPGFDDSDESRAYPFGFGHATGAITPASGLLRVSGQLADGAPFTASLKPTEIGAYLLWTNPYGTRTHSFLAGALADDSVNLQNVDTNLPDGSSGSSGTVGASIDVLGGSGSFSLSEGSLSFASIDTVSININTLNLLDDPSIESSARRGATRSEGSSRARFVPQNVIHVSNRFLTWKKAPLPAATPAAKRDKSYRAGFGPLGLYVSLDPWFPPITRATATQPIVTLAQRLGIAYTNVASGQIAVSHYTANGIRLISGDDILLPNPVTLNAAGKILVGTPNDTKWQITALDPATGTFRGSFVLTDATPTSANPGKTTKRLVPFSGTLRQRLEGDDNIFGVGHFLLPALPGAASDEQSSGQINFTTNP